MKQWRRAAAGIVQQQVEFAAKSVVVSRARELLSQLLKRRDQGFWNVASAKPAPMSVFIGLAFGDRQLFHWKFQAACPCNDNNAQQIVRDLSPFPLLKGRGLR